MFELICGTGRLGRLEVQWSIPFKGGSSMPGDSKALGEIDKVDPESETSDGAASNESALETSEVEGEGRDISVCLRFGEKCGLTVRACCRGARGRVKDQGSVVLSYRSGQGVAALRRTTRRLLLFMLPFHQFFTALSLRPSSLRAISAHRFPISATRRSIKRPSSGLIGS